MADFIAARRCSKYIYDDKTLNRCKREATTVRVIEIPKYDYSFRSSNNVHVSLSVGSNSTEVEMLMCAEHAEVHDARQKEMNK